jgi:hypothetical protein
MEIRLFFCFEMDDSAVKPFSVFRYMHLMRNMVDVKQKRLIMLDLFVNFFLERLQIIGLKKFDFILNEIERNVHGSSLLSPPSVADFHVIIYSGAENICDFYRKLAFLSGKNREWVKRKKFIIEENKNL